MKGNAMHSLNRRIVLKSIGAAGAALAAPAIWTGARAQNMLTVGDGGGAYTTAWTKAYYKPFFDATGIEVVPIERRDNPAAEIRAIVETGNYKWDFCGSIGQDVAHALTEGNFLEELDLSGDAEQIPDTMKGKTFVASDVAAFILAYRTDKFSQPITAVEMWDVKNFPGRRGLRQLARDTLQIALVADGVAPGDISTVLADEAGWQRAFAKLDKIKPEIAVWWTSAAQTPTLLQTAEVDICPTFNSRAQTVVDAGTPLAITWKGGFYTNFGWVIPRGSPKADLARQFIAFCAKAEQQAIACAGIGVGPSNPRAFDHIDAERAKALPTYADNIAGMAPLDYVFWGPRQEQAANRFNDWLLK